MNNLWKALDNHAIVIYTDEKGVIQNVNSKFCEISGYTEDELVGNTNAILYTTPHPKNYYKRIWDVINTGEVWSGEICYKRKDGALYWVNSTITPDVNSENVIVGHTAIHTEITRAKYGSILQKAQQEATLDIIQGETLSISLHNVLQQLSKVEPNLKFSVMQLDDKNNLHHLTSLGLPLDFIKETNNISLTSCMSDIGKRSKCCIYNNTTNSRCSIIEKHARDHGLLSSISLPILGKDEKVYGLISIYKSVDGKISDDLIELHGDAAKLMTVLFIFYRERSQYYAQNSKLNNLIQSSPFCIHELGLDGRLETINAAGLKMFDVDEENDVLGINYLTIPRKSDQRQFINELFQKSLKGSSERFEFEAGTEDNPTFYSSCFVPLYNSNNEIYRILGITEDVTERHRNRLELIEAKELAQSANKAKSNFLASMSHDLRTPLNAILGFSQIIEQKIFGAEVTGKNEEYIGLIISSGYKMLTLVDEILDLSKVESGEFTLSEETFNLRSLIEMLSTEFSEIAKIHKVKVVNRLYMPDVDFVGDKQAISQIFQNLTSNALKFSPENSSISISLLSQSNGDISLKVSDEGAGFSPQALNNVAEPFFTDDAYKARKDKSTGLGLFITKRFAELHSAYILVKNRKLRGASVEVVFPSDRIKGLCDKSSTKIMKVMN